MDESIEKGEKEEAIVVDIQKDDNTQRYDRQGMTLSQKSDIGVCVTMIGLVVLSVFITSLKIILIDMNSDKYADLFGYNASTAYFKYKYEDQYFKQ